MTPSTQREIRFRAWGISPWDENEKEMKYFTIDEILANLGFEYGLPKNLPYDNDRKWEVMQWTGLQDKNGKDIYEGDVVSMFHGTQLSEVFYSEGAFVVLNQPGAGVEPQEDLLFNRLDVCEVIGNTMENPDLLTT